VPKAREGSRPVGGDRRSPGDKSRLSSLRDPDVCHVRATRRDEYPADPPAETPIGGASLSGGMRGGDGRGGAMGTRPGGRTLVPFGYEGGIGMGDRLIGTPMTRRDRPRRPTGPGFGYPFRIPPSLSGGSPSMAMP
jgi:hypothetical protein